MNAANSPVPAWGEARHEYGISPASLQQIFDAMPYGVVIADLSGAILTANRAALALFGRSLDPAVRQALRQLLSGPERSEIRVELEDRHRGFAWVTMARLPGDDRVLLHLRCRSQDEQPRLDGSSMETEATSVSLLGRMRVETVTGTLGGSWLHQRPGQLFKYLLCRRRDVVHTEEVAEALWPSYGVSAMNSVRYYVHALRWHLEPGRPKRAPSAYVLTDGGGYRLNLERIAIDVDTFSAHVEAGLDALGRGERSVALTELEAGVALYRGDFLAEDRFAEWTFRERECLRQRAGRAWSALRDLMHAEGDLRRATIYAERLEELDPLDADVQRRLLGLCAERGRRSEANRRFAEYRARLKSELGQQPEFELSDVLARGRPG